MDILLPDVLYADSHHIPLEECSKPEYRMENTMEYLRYRAQLEEIYDNYQGRHEHNLPIVIVETSRGQLYFSSSEFGRKALQSFYQHLTDDYFSPHSENGIVREYHMRDFPLAMLNADVDASYQKEGGTGPYRFTEDKGRIYNHYDLGREGQTLMRIFHMRPTAEDYQYLVHDRECKSNSANEAICGLLKLKTHGYLRDTILNSTFIHRKDFLELSSAINRYINSGERQKVSSSTEKKDLFDLLDEVQLKADSILKKRYDVRGHRSLEKRLEDSHECICIGGISLENEEKRLLLKQGSIYRERIYQRREDLHYVCADLRRDKLRISAMPLTGKIYKVENGKVIPLHSIVRKKSVRPKGNGPQL